MEDIQRHLLEDLEESKPVKDTWDIPFNPSKTVNISDPEIFKKLNCKRKDMECSHKTQDFKCLCGTAISGSKCKKCDTIFCSRKACSASRKPETDCNGTASYEPEDISLRDLKVDEEKAEEKDCMKMKKNSGTFGTGQQAGKLRINPFMMSSNLPVNAVESKNPPVGTGRGRGRGRGFINPVVVPGSRPKVIQPQSRQPEPQPAVELEKRQSALKPKEMQSLVESEISQQAGRCEDKSGMVAGVKAAEQLVAADDAEKLQDNQPEKTNVDMLAVCKLFGKQEDLRSYETKTFFISAFYSPQRVFIFPCAALKDDFPDLLDEINDFCLDASCLSEDPSPGSCVCAPKEDETMHRAVVLRKIQNSDFVVRFLDTGEERKVSLADLKPLPDNLYKVPLIGFIVKLKGIPDELPLLSLREFHTNFVPSVTKQKWKLTEVSQMQDGTWEGKLVTKTAPLAESILKLQVWQWESHFKSGCHNDTEIFQAQEWPYADVLKFEPSDFPPEPIRMELCGIDDEKCMVAFMNVKHRSIEAEADVLHRQLCRYIDHVTATPHYPKIKENFLFLPDSRLPVRRFWRRAIRLDQSNVYCHDTHEFFLLEGLGETRRLCPEFFKVPALVVIAAVKGKKSAAREFLKTLIVGKFYRVSVEASNEEDDMLVVTIES